MKNLAMWAVIVFLTIGLYNMFKNPQANVGKGNSIIFSEFLRNKCTKLRTLLLFFFHFLDILKTVVHQTSDSP